MKYQIELKIVESPDNSNERADYASYLSEKFENFEDARKAYKAAWIKIKEVLKKDMPIEYTEEIGNIGDLFTVEEWKKDVEDGNLIDYDGWGTPVKDGKSAKDFDLYPSQIDLLPKDATHVLWFNR